MTAIPVPVVNGTMTYQILPLTHVQKLEDKKNGAQKKEIQKINAGEQKCNDKVQKISTVLCDAITTN